jgi:polyferredoxin
MNESIMELCILGLLILVGVVWGRLFCGKVCPNRYFFDFLYKIPFPIKIKAFKGDKYLRYLKYSNLFLPLFIQSSEKKLHESMERNLLHHDAWFLIWLFFILAVVILSHIILRLPFCKYLCPIGAMHSLLNPISVYKYKVDEQKCNKCGKCVRNCKMNVELYKTPNHLECIRCGDCKIACPTKAITSGFRIK